MEFFVKKTTDLTKEEENGILLLFNSVFNKCRSLEQFRNQFLHNPLGYSYHSIIMETDQIVGSYSCIPDYYFIGDKRHLCALAVDNMISQNYRGYTNFYRMVTNMHTVLMENGFDFSFCFPNDNAYQVFVGSKLMKDIGNLTTYCLPYRIGGIKPPLKTLNLFSMAFVRFYVFCCSLFSDRQVYHFSIGKEADSYNATRYKRLDGNYQIGFYQGSSFVYKLMEYNGIRSVFLIDVFEKSSYNFNKAVQFIIKKHRKEFDILLYVGYLPFRFHGMIALPLKMSPKNFHFVGKILRGDKVDPGFVFNFGYWDVNLSNFDLL
jgi:hypothetical protein